MAIGDQPSTNWDYSLFEDHIRLGLVGAQLLFTAGLCAIKGDWQEFCHTFAFSTWRTYQSPCYACWATVGNNLNDAGFGVGNTTLWPTVTPDDYDSLCSSCEFDVMVRTIQVLQAIKASLFYDRRQKRWFWSMPTH